MEINKKLEGKTIKTAYVDGGEIEIIFTDESIFVYDASDGGYSSYDLREGEKTMSRIKDLLAEEQNIDDLKRPLYQELGEMIYVRAKSWDGLRSWFRSNAEYEAGKDDDGHTEWYFENFEELCEQAVNDMLGKLIEEEHLDISDETYNRAIEYARDWLADALADFESECVQDYVMDRKYILDEVKERNGQC